MKFATAAAIGVVGVTLMAAPLAPAQAHGGCGPLLPLCIAGAVVAGAATVATLPLAIAAAPYGYAPPPAYYPAARPYYPAAPAYYAPTYYAPAYYPGPVAAYGYGPYWHRAYYGGRPRAWRHHY
jgi:hypothetical protein